MKTHSQKTNMKTVLCYGDSNTWGYNAAIKGRHGYHVRWTGVVRDILNKDQEEYEIVEEGLNGYSISD